MMNIFKKIKEFFKWNYFSKKLRRCVVDALVDSYYYPSEIYVLRSGNDFVHVRKRQLKNEKKYNKKALQGRSLKHIYETSVVTVAHGAVMQMDSRLYLDCAKLEIQAQSCINDKIKRSVRSNRIAK